MHGGMTNEPEFTSHKWAHREMEISTENVKCWCCGRKSFPSSWKENELQNELFIQLSIVCDAHIVIVRSIAT